MADESCISLKAQLEEAKRELTSVKTEKQKLEEKVDTLETAQERMLQMKESQDNEVSYLTSRVKELKEEIEGLRWQLEEVEERSRTEVEQLTIALSVYQSAESSSGPEVLADNARLKQDLSTTSSQLHDIQQTADRLDGEVREVRDQLKTALEEVAVWRNKAELAQDEIESLKLHLDTKQSEKLQPQYMDALRLNEQLKAEVSRLSTMVNQQGQVQGLDISSGQDDQVDVLKEKIRREQQLVLQLENDLQVRDTALEEAREELDVLRRQGLVDTSFRMLRDGSEPSGRPGLVDTPGSAARTRRDSTDSRLSDIFMDHQEVWVENNKLKGDLDHALRENRRLSSRIKSWESELERSQLDLDQEGLRSELTRAIKTLQMKEHKLDEVQEENLSLLEERDSLQLRLSSLMRQMESAANSRAMTPVPGGSGSAAGPGLHPGILDPQQQIFELNAKLSELRKLNYALDVELQKERGQRAQQHTRIMEPRAREADRMLQPSDSPVKHL